MADYMDNYLDWLQSTTPEERLQMCPSCRTRNSELPADHRIKLEGSANGWPVRVCNYSPLEVVGPCECLDDEDHTLFICRCGCHRGLWETLPPAAGIILPAQPMAPATGAGLMPGQWAVTRRPRGEL